MVIIFKRILLILFLLMGNVAIAQVWVEGYYRRNGTYVEGHYRSNPDGNPYNNWSYPGNVNPYTGVIAGGNPSTYLYHYYKKRIDNNNIESISRLSLCSEREFFRILEFPYYNLDWPQNYTLMDNGLAFGKANSTASGYLLYDKYDNLVGQIIYTKQNLRRYDIYDAEGRFIANARKPSTGSGILLGFLCGLFLSVVIFATDGGS